MEDRWAEQVLDVELAKDVDLGWAQDVEEIGKPVMLAAETMWHGDGLSYNQVGDDHSNVPEHGTVAIQDNRMIVTDPGEMGTPASICVPVDERLAVVVDGMRVLGRLSVTRAQQIHIYGDARAPLRKVEMRLSDNRMVVFMKVIVERGVRVRVEDSPPVSHIDLHVQEEFTLPPALAIRSLFSMLRTAGYEGQIDYEALEALRSSDITQELAVLHGSSPVAAEPACSVPVMSPRPYNPIQKRRIPRVSAGMTVAAFREAQPGSVGRNVLGESQFPAAVQDAPILGEGVILQAGNVIAAREGRLVTTEYKVDVLPHLVISHDVTPKSGAVLFSGDVTINGSVVDGGYVQAKGTLTIHGSVKDAAVTAEDGIYILGDILHSTVVSGAFRMACRRLSPQMALILSRLKDFRDHFVTVLGNASDFNGQPERRTFLGAVLLRRCHAELEESLRTFVQSPDQELEKIDRNYAELLKFLRKVLSGTDDEANLSDKIDEIISLFVSLQRKMMAASADERESCIRAESITGSVVRSAGDIIVTQKGAFTTSLESGGSIYINGVVRGGFLIANRRVFARTAGTSLGVETSIRVAHRSGLIALQTRFPNTLLQAGGNRDRNQTAEYNVRFR